MSKKNVPFAPKPDKWTMDNMAKDWPSVAQYIAYLEDLDRIVGERERSRVDASGTLSQMPITAPSVVQLLDIIFANDNDTIEEEGPVGPQIAKAIHSHLLATSGRPGRADLGWVRSVLLNMKPSEIDDTARLIFDTIATGGRESREDRYREALESLIEGWTISGGLREEWSRLRIEDAKQALATINVKEPEE